MEALGLLLLLGFYVGIAVLFYKWGASINKKNGRDKDLGGIVGLFGGFIGILVLYLLGKKDKE